MGTGSHLPAARVTRQSKMAFLAWTRIRRLRFVKISTAASLQQHQLAQTCRAILETALRLQRARIKMVLRIGHNLPERTFMARPTQSQSHRNVRKQSKET